MSDEIMLVPHTHWDREWYEPFQVFRMRLVDVIDSVIELAESDPDFRFTLDGQMAAVDDYLEIRPENRQRLAALVRNGQLAVGPWHILLDEFLSSGETIIRNLEMGWLGAAWFGGAMPVGYLPDMFGHCAQMPQILKRAGVNHACVWRGVPRRVDGHAFRWQAPDGSAVRAEYLFDGYGNALQLFAVPDGLDDAISTYVNGTAARYGDDPALGMLGTDHMAPRAEVMAEVRKASSPVRIGTLTDYVQGFAADDGALPVVEGELRSHARANVLPGVISTRVGLKAAMARAERAVAQAEALAVRTSTDVDRYLKLAWRRIIESSAHDSVTGCGADSTAEQVVARLAEATHIGKQIRDRVATGLATDVPVGGYLIVNTLARPRTALVELDVPAPDSDDPVAIVRAGGSAIPVQELDRSETVLANESISSDYLDTVLGRIHGQELYGLRISSYEVTPGRLVFRLVRHAAAPFDVAALRSELAAAKASWPGEWRVEILAEPRRRVVVAVPVAASGQEAVCAVLPYLGEPARSTAVQVGESWLASAEVRADVSDDGTLIVTGADGTTLRGVGRMVSGGDRGDTYNYGPPLVDQLVDAPVGVATTVVESGPLRGVLRVDRTYDWPVSLAADRDARSSVSSGVVVTTLVELRVGEPYVRLSVSFVNPARDHRVRLHVPLPEPVAWSMAEGQCAVTTRGLTPEGGGGEYPLPTFPAASFVSAGPATVLLDHVTEYELVDDGAELALTLLRAVGMLSRNVHPLRDEPAGPEIAVPEAQCVGAVVSARIAVLPSAGGWAAAEAVRHAEEFRNELFAAPGRGVPGSPLPHSSPGLAVSGPGVVVSGIRPRDDGVEVRLVAMSDSAVTADVSGPFVIARRTDLMGRPIDDLPVFDGRIEVQLGPWEIATLRLT